MAKIFYARVDEFWRKEEKYAYLDEKKHRGNIEWQEIQPDAKHNWLTGGMHEEFETFLALGTKEAKKSKSISSEVLFDTYSRGISTSRDEWVYSFDRATLEKNVFALVDNYNSEVARLSRSGKVTDFDSFVNNASTFLKWTDRLKDALRLGQSLTFKSSQIQKSSYRPFTEQFVYFDPLLTHRRYQQHLFFPLNQTQTNLAICLTDIGYRSPFSTLIVHKVPELHLCASTDTFQCFPFYTYNEDGTNRRENITDWALEQFRSHYKDKRIKKWYIFYYVYALLNHPLYRERYAANLKRELPRTPFAPDFRAFAETGKRLAEIHVNYEQQTEYPLERIETPGKPLDWRVEKMKLSKDKRSLIYNDFLTLSGIPSEVFDYRLGNRSALEWIIDQYQVSTDKRSGITNDPNRDDDPQYIVRLIGQVITVSLETVTLVRSLTRDRLTA